MRGRRAGLVTPSAGNMSLRQLTSVFEGEGCELQRLAENPVCRCEHGTLEPASAFKARQGFWDVEGVNEVRNLTGLTSTLAIWVARGGCPPNAGALGTSWPKVTDCVQTRCSPCPSVAGKSNRQAGVIWCIGASNQQVRSRMLKPDASRGVLCTVMACGWIPQVVVRWCVSTPITGSCRRSGRPGHTSSGS